MNACGHHAVCVYWHVMCVCVLLCLCVSDTDGTEQSAKSKAEGKKRGRAIEVQKSQETDKRDNKQQKRSKIVKKSQYELCVLCVYGVYVFVCLYVLCVCVCVYVFVIAFVLLACLCVVCVLCCSVCRITSLYFCLAVVWYYGCAMNLFIRVCMCVCTESKFPHTGKLSLSHWIPSKFVRIYVCPVFLVSINRNNQIRGIRTQETDRWYEGQDQANWRWHIQY